jgi:hypothetical protein
LSYPQNQPIRIHGYPMSSVIGSGGAPRFGLVQHDRGIIIESDRISPLKVGDVEFQSKLPVPGNVLSPGLPFYLRNSLLDLDTYQNKASALEEEANLQMLQEELATAAAEAQKQAEALAKEEEKKNKLGIWEIMTFSGVGLAATAIVMYVWTQK